MKMKRMLGLTLLLASVMTVHAQTDYSALKASIAAAKNLSSG